MKENEYSTSLYNTGEELCNCTNRFKLKKKKEREQIKVHVVKTSNEGNSHVVVLQTMVIKCVAKVLHVRLFFLCQQITLTGGI